MIEVMACGTPVVALRGGAVPEVIVDGVTGVICDVPEELPAAMEKATHLDPAACRRHVAAHFGVGRFGAGYEQIYRNVLRQRTRMTLREVLTEPPGVAERASA